jgi:hypothetical protein
MKKDLKAQVLENCLDQLDTGMNVEEVLSQYPDLADELRGPLEAAHAMRWLAASSAIPEGAQTRSREKFFDAAATSLRLDSRKRARTFVQPSRKQNPLRFGPALSLGVTILLVVLCLGAFTSYTASARALPGEALYPVKIVSEEVSKWLTRSPERKLELDETYDARRIDEIDQLLSSSESEASFRSVEVSLSGPILSKAGNDWLVGKVQIHLLPDTELVGQLDEGYVVIVHGLLQEDGTVVATRINSRQIQLEGRLERLSDDEWRLNRVDFSITPRTLIQGNLFQDGRATVILLQTATGGFEARLISMKDQPKDSDLDISTPTNEKDDDHSGSISPTIDKDEDKSGSGSGSDSTKDKTPTPTRDDDDDHKERTKTPTPPDDDDDHKDPSKTPTPPDDDDHSEKPRDP